MIAEDTATIPPCVRCGVKPAETNMGSNLYCDECYKTTPYETIKGAPVTDESRQKVLDMAARAELAGAAEERKATGANAIQYGGDHYKKLGIQHWDYVEANGIPYLEACAIKYLTRWRDKGGVTDLRKAIHFIEKRIELEEASTPSGVVGSVTQTPPDRPPLRPGGMVYPSNCPHPDAHRILIQTVAGNGWKCDLCGHKEAN